MAKFDDLAAHLRHMIQSGQLRPGEQLPSTAQLTQQHQVSYGTVRGAMLVLKAQRLVEGRQGVGVFVANRPDASIPA